MRSNKRTGNTCYVVAPPTFAQHVSHCGFIPGQEDFHVY